MAAARDGAGDGIARQADLARLTEEDDPEGVRELFEAFFASIHWRRKNGLAKGYRAALVYAHFAAAGLDVRVEEATSRGRFDMAVPTPGCVHLYEFKVVDRGREGGAGPGTRLRGQVPASWGAGEFGREERNIVGFEIA